MARLSNTELKAILAAEKADALSGDASTLSADRAKAMDYYNGDMSSDMPAATGRSSVTSSDVADTVEGLMPALMEIFCGGDEVVRFEAVGKEDVAAAEQETDYVNHVFMQKNPGFLVIYSMIKDALLSKVGIVKVWWEKYEKESRETYLDMTEEGFAALVSNPEIEIIEHTPHANEEYPEQSTHDVTVVTKTNYECAKVEPVPPEEFGISRRAKTVRDANYCFHEVIRTESELIDQGYDEDQVKNLTGYPGTESGVEQSARDTVDENQGKQGDESLNTANRPIKVTEHYVRMDYNRDGRASLYRVTTGGDDGIVLTRDGQEDVEPVDIMPFAAMTPVPVTHRFFGKSIADLVMDIQQIKTALVRGMMDNLYLHNNPRVEVAASHAGPTTLDDLLVSRPGGIVRSNTPGGIVWQTVPDITTSIYPALEYFDATREWRTGVTRQGQGIDANALQNQSATAVNQAFTAAQARMKLIARIFAETGIRDLFALLHATIRKNGKKAETVKLRNTWVDVNPREWKERNDLTINVGLGSGGKQERIAGLMMLVGLQKEALLAGKTNLVKDEHLYKSATELAKLLEYKNVDQFFSDPKNEPPPVPQEDPKITEIKLKAEIEKLQAQADIETNDRKTAASIALEEKKFALEKELKTSEHRMKMQELQAKSVAQMMQPKKVGPDGKEVEGEKDLSPLLMQVLNQLERANKPKRIVRDPQSNKVVGYEIMDNEPQEPAPDMVQELITKLEGVAKPKRAIRGPDGSPTHIA